MDDNIATSGQRWRGNMATFASMVLWSTGFIATEHLVHSSHPMAVATGRLLVAAVAMLALTLASGLWRRLGPVPWREIAITGATGLGVGTLLLVWGQKLSDPVTTAVIASLLPLLSAVMGTIEGSERIGLRLAAGIVLAIIGAAIVSLPENASGLRIGYGEGLVVLSMVMWIWYSRRCVQRLGALPDLALAALTMLAASLVLALASVVLAVSGVALGFDASAAGLAALAWLGIAAIGASTVLWLYGARRLGVTVASIHQNCVPLYVIALALAAGIEPTPVQIIGAALVMAGAVVAQLGPAAARSRPQPPDHDRARASS